MRLSVVIPVLDEAARIGALLDVLAATPGLDELVVVDGGSQDGTIAEVGSRKVAHLLHAPRRRAAQLNAGAAAAQGDVLLFLHADGRLPPDAVRWIETVLADPSVVAGAFRTWTVFDQPGPRPWFAPLLHLADLRSRYARLPYGDQALFVRADAFRRAGGFPDIALMEDLELARRLQKLGRICIVPASVTVSGRRFVARPVVYTLLVNLFPALYRIGVPPALLAQLYGDPR